MLHHYHLAVRSGKTLLLSLLLIYPNTMLHSLLHLNDHDSNSSQRKVTKAAEVVDQKEKLHKGYVCKIHFEEKLERSGANTNHTGIQYLLLVKCP